MLKRLVACSSIAAWLIVSPVVNSAQEGGGGAGYCQVSTFGTRVEVVRPGPEDPPIDDVNWFARPVPNPAGHWIIGFASHDQNYLYDLTTGARIRIPDKSDAVATPDGRYVTVPSHYTATRTVNFYPTAALLDRLARGQDAADVPPVFAHEDADVADVYYQSVGVVSTTGTPGRDSTTVYRMMFSGSNVTPAPGFRIVDYTFTESGGRVTVRASKAMRLCPEIVRDMATPFISKDGRYIAAHDATGEPARPPSLRIFEITKLDPDAQTTSCAMRVDLGFAAGKADFSYDGSRLTFHISKHDYLTPFINGGLKAQTITDVALVDLTRDQAGRITGHGRVTRVTTSIEEGIGSYFPAFLPDGRIFYISNAVPKESAEPKRFSFRVVDPRRERWAANVFASARDRARADAIGRLWREACAPDMSEFKDGEAPWYFLSLDRQQCEALVRDRGKQASIPVEELRQACAAERPPTR